MHRDRWQEILETVKSSFEVEETGKSTSEDLGGTETEFIVFSGPLGRLKLEFSTHPAILETNTKYKKRIGADVIVEHTYSPTETVNHLEIWRWDVGSEEWIPFKTDIF